MEITKFKEGDKVYGSCLSRNILPFYGEVVSAPKGYSYAYISVFTKKGINALDEVILREWVGNNYTFNIER